ncbi:MAG: acylphosphatase, partial [Saprospiraceae bacterium]|nr:acylphosphatase [Saprospiraceae bacterium]
MHTYHIHIKGQVQGVGFRPFVWRLAQQHALPGWVNNASDGLHIRVNANDTALRNFLNDLQEGAPEIAHIHDIATKTVDFESFTAFSILQSDVKAAPNLMFSPDFALCRECRKEMHDATNRRFNYPFITCTLCGPRFSIVQQL